LGEILSEFLTNQNFEVDYSKNARETVKTLAEKNYDVILLDLKMPLMSGEEFLETLEKIKMPVNPRIILLTGQKTDMETLNSPFIFGKISKPFELNEIQDGLVKAMALPPP